MLHQELQTAGVAAGTLLTITKLAGANGQYWRVENGTPPTTDNGHVQEPPQRPSNQPAHTPPSTNGEVHVNGVDGFTGLEHLLGHCLAASSRVCSQLNGQVQYTSEDVRRLGTTLFIECNRKGILPEPLQQA